MMKTEHSNLRIERGLAEMTELFGDNGLPVLSMDTQNDMNDAEKV